MHRRLPVFEDKGFVLLRDYSGPAIDPAEWEAMEYKDWKSGGDTNFAPIASANGELDCGGFWDHGKPDKDALWTSNAPLCPTLKGYVEAVQANFGRVRVIKLNPSDEAAARRQLHVDDNNRLNPDGDGWVVRSWLELTENPGAKFILREDRDDESSESLIPLHRGMQFVIDTERLWHVVHNPGPEPRYALITSWESGDALERWIESQLPVGAAR
jgi:hypothetical protein